MRFVKGKVREAHAPPIPAVSIVCDRRKKKKSINPSLPLKTPSRAVSMRSGDGRTGRGRSGDTDIGPSEPLIAIERRMRGKSPHSERSVFEGMVVVSGRRGSLWLSRGCLVAALMPFSRLRIYDHTKSVYRKFVGHRPV
ncbi:hypothetical protein PILCRDRAFT_597612 [Piloderma croceum F 1598]|uniref:Uncharacterized protein n=1 Tax=Piloderma croceum (strain F 1598) TaxID=765440 RepID=A0A0C3FE50_PILCF|nr:hypothetical protein PILCRDRAFT_597612 [Piloderma croceum F 1598]